MKKEEETRDVFQSRIYHTCQYTTDIGALEHQMSAIVVVSVFTTRLNCCDGKVQFSKCSLIVPRRM